MDTVKRIELVIPEVALREITTLLDRHGITGYTVARGLSGRGDRGVQPGDGLGGEFSNASVLIACPPERSLPLLEALRGPLSRLGGLCLVSDAQSLRH